MLFISSCGGGKAEPFSLFLPTNSTIIIDEDNTYSSRINSSTNYKSQIIYEILTSSVNGKSNISPDGNFNYLPNQDYFGNDSIILRVTASRLDDNDNLTGETISKSLPISITINPINDPPNLNILDDLTNYSDRSLIFDDTLMVNVEISDIDNDISDLTFSGDLPNESVAAVLDIIQSSENDENQRLIFYLNNIETAGLFKMSLCVSDLEFKTCNGEVEAYYISSKEIKSVDYNCDENGSNCETSEQYLYYLIGGANTNAKTDYIFIADQITGTEGAGSSAEFRQRLLESVNRLKDSDAGKLFQEYFNVLILEEVASTGFSLFDIETGCYSSWDPRIYCIGNVDRNLISSIYPNWDVASFLTSISGRGVAQGSVNIQPLSNRTAEVVQHELGHSHAFLGDEYDSRGERTFPIYYADFSVNTTSTSDATKVKWSHLIDDINMISGYTDGVNQYCYNYEDGSVYTREGESINYEDCDCYMRQFPDSEFPGINSDSSCPTKIGHFEGTYYGEIGTYRPRWLSVMWCCDDEYGKVNVEGFAIGSILNQGFVDYTVSSNGIEDIDIFDQSSIGNSITFNLNAIYDVNKLILKWYVDGVEQSSFQNQTQVTFNRPTNNAMTTYSWKVEDLTGDLIAPNDTNNPLDFYEGYFENSYYFDPDENTNPNYSQNPYVSSWIWHKIDGSYQYDDEVDLNNLDNYLYAELCCSLGSSLKINWENYQQESSSTQGINKKILRKAKVNETEKIVNLDLSKDDISVKNIERGLADLRQIKETKISKKDIYSLSFFNEDMKVVYTVGIGNPFNARVQHIGYEESNVFSIDIPIKNFSIAIPSEIEPSYVSINKRNEFNEYNIIKLVEF